MEEYSGFAELNALGNPMKVMGVDAADGGRAGVGPIGNTRPTGIVAEGINIDTYPRLFSDRNVRKGMSTTRNESIGRGMSGKR